MMTVYEMGLKNIKYYPPSLKSFEWNRYTVADGLGCSANIQERLKKNLTKTF